MDVDFSAFNELPKRADDFFDVVKEEAGGWELVGDVWFFCSDRHARIFIAVLVA